MLKYHYSILVKCTVVVERAYLSLSTSRRLVDHDSWVGKWSSLPLCSCREQESTHRCCHSEAHSVDITWNVLHGVKNGESSLHGSARTVWRKSLVRVSDIMYSSSDVRWSFFLPTAELVICWLIEFRYSGTRTWSDFVSFTCWCTEWCQQLDRQMLSTTSGIPSRFQRRRLLRSPKAESDPSEVLKWHHTGNKWSNLSSSRFRS